MRTSPSDPDLLLRRLQTLWRDRSGEVLGWMLGGLLGVLFLGSVVSDLQAQVPRVLADLGVYLRIEAPLEPGGFQDNLDPALLPDLPFRLTVGATPRGFPCGAARSSRQAGPARPRSRGWRRWMAMRSMPACRSDPRSRACGPEDFDRSEASHLRPQRPMDARAPVRLP